MDLFLKRRTRNVWKGQQCRGACAGAEHGERLDPRQGIAATTFYDQIKAFFTDCAAVLRGQGDTKGPGRYKG